MGRSLITLLHSSMILLMLGCDPTCEGHFFDIVFFENKLEQPINLNFRFKEFEDSEDYEYLSAELSSLELKRVLLSKSRHDQVLRANCLTDPARKEVEFEMITLDSYLICFVPKSTSYEIFSLQDFCPEDTVQIIEGYHNNE